jgi:hypothetical protein
MGMTNRVIPAQGEERGASYSLIGLDGDAPRKFQSRQEQFLCCARSAVMGLNRLNTYGFCRKPHCLAKLVSGSVLRRCAGLSYKLNSMRLVPIVPYPHIDLERHRKFRRLRHMGA